MPHVIVKLAAGWSDDRKQELAQRITRDVIDVLDHDADAVSVAMEDVPAEDWMATVYEPEIVGRRSTLIKRPGYGSLADGNAPSGTE
jgi:4-oxalocrotonate tautomerase